MRTRLMVGALAAISFSAFGTTLAPTLPPGIKAIIQQPAPPLRVLDDKGVMFDLSSQRGYWVFVHFWATWCVPCQREMPSIARMKKRIPEDLLRVVIVNTADSEDAIFAFLGSIAPDLNSYRDPDGKYTELWKPRGLPATFMVDPAGQIRFMALGGREWDDAVYIHFLTSFSH